MPVGVVGRRENRGWRRDTARVRSAQASPDRGRAYNSGPMRDPRFSKLADVLVNYSIGAKPGQLVRISGPPVSQPLIVELYIKCLEAGAHPVVRMVPEELNELFLKMANDEQ